LIEFLLWSFLGCAAGIFTGLIPGIHNNTVAVIAVSALFAGRMELILFVLSMAIVHSFVEFIPAIVLGVPGEDTFLSLLPGHEMLLQGKGLEAIFLTISGGLASGIIAILLMPLVFSVAERIFNLAYAWIGWILLCVLITMLFSGKKTHLISNSISIFLAGTLGISALTIGIGLVNPVFSLVTGFFATAGLCSTVVFKTKIPAQETVLGKLEIKKIIGNGFLGSAGAAVIALLPGVGPSHAAFLIGKFRKSINHSSFLALLGGINTANIMFSVLFFLTIGKTRTGVAVAVRELGGFDTIEGGLLITAALLALGLGAIACILLGNIIASRVNTIPYPKLSVFVILFLVGITFWMEGIIGIIVLVVATAAGIFTVLSGNRKSNLMAFLIVPTIIYYLGIL